MRTIPTKSSITSILLTALLEYLNLLLHMKLKVVRPMHRKQNFPEFGTVTLPHYSLIMSISSATSWICASLLLNAKTLKDGCLVSDWILEA